MRLRVSVAVSDLGGGILEALPAYPEDLTFDNTYTPPVTPPPVYDGIHVPVVLRKVLEGRPLSGGEFEFILKDAAGNVIARSFNDAAGEIRFPDRYFRVPGIYLYEITEVIGSQEDVRYDRTVFTLRIRVTASEGTLHAESSFRKDGVPFGGDIAFLNVYDPPKTGDSQPALILTLFTAAAALMALAFLMREKRRPSAGGRKDHA